MKPITLVAALAVLFSMPILGEAQGEKPATAKPAAPMKAEAKAEKAAAPTKAEAKAEKPAVRRLTSRSHQDARECLSFPTNREVIVCAEKYL